MMTTLRTEVGTTLQSPEHHRPDEHELRAAVIAGDAAAWRVLYDGCFDFLYAYVLYRADRNRDRAEVVVQEVWAVAVRRIRRFDPDRAAFRTWVRGIADKVLANHWRRWARRDRTEQPLPTTADQTLTARENGPRRLEESELLAVALEAMPDGYREVLTGKYWEGLTVAELAERTGDSAKAVESRLTRARALFKKVHGELGSGA
ncbi:MAG: sigma-70 family RNA polymerase sigma factor [bacterium]|nr:sigma-70 family RNA polymerase sigma factor [bacterium]